MEPLKSSTPYKYRILPEVIIVLLPPVASAVRLIFPGFLKRSISPRPRMLREPIITAGAWHAIGYALMATFALMAMVF